jgi:hypothetical protein
MELKEMLDKLEEDRNMELSERLKLEEEIQAKQVKSLSTNKGQRFTIFFISVFLFFSRVFPWKN